MANTVRPTRNPVAQPKAYAVAGSTHLFQGDIVALNGSGFAYLATNDSGLTTATTNFALGIAVVEADGSASATNGTVQVLVQECEVLLTDDGGDTLAVTSQGSKCYVGSTANQFHLTAATHDCAIGVLVQALYTGTFTGTISTTQAWVRCGLTAAKVS